MSDEDSGRFLARWSKRKVAAREGRPVDERESDAAASAHAAPSVAPVEAIAPPGASGRPDEGSSAVPPALPPVESLQGLASEYRDFMRAEVDPALKRAALRKLFADPHFNVMDGLDVYIDDYSIPDPIPEAMLASLEHAKPLFRPLFEARDAAARESSVEQTAPPPVDTDRVGDAPPTEGTECPDTPTLSHTGGATRDGERSPEESG